jgi:MerR family transcriptional regulator, copper efflux regulator
MPEKRPYIGEIAKDLGISPKTVRWYEAQGLLAGPERTESGYRSYSAEDIERLKFIRKAFAFGFSSKEVKDILELRAHGAAPCDLVIDLIGGKIGTVQQQIKDLQQLERELTELRRQWKGKRNEDSEKAAKVCSCIEETEQPKGRKKHG